MSQVVFEANDKYYSELTQEYNPGDTTLYLVTPPDHVPTILVLARGTSNETVFTVTGKTLNSIVGCARLKGANVELLTQTPITCLNNAEFINQYKTFLGINWKSAWADDIDYVKNDGVSYLGSSYVSLQNSLNKLPTDTDYWQIAGVQGSQGIQGVAGLGVPAGGATGEVLKKISGTDNDTEWGSAGLDSLQVVLTAQIFN